MWALGGQTESLGFWISNVNVAAWVTKLRVVIWWLYVRSVQMGHVRGKRAVVGIGVEQKPKKPLRNPPKFVVPKLRAFYAA